MIRWLETSESRDFILRLWVISTWGCLVSFDCSFICGLPGLPCIWSSNFDIARALKHETSQAVSRRREHLNTMLLEYQATEWGNCCRLQLESVPSLHVFAHQRSLVNPWSQTNKQMWKICPKINPKSFAMFEKLETGWTTDPRKERKLLNTWNLRLFIRKEHIWEEV